MIEVSIPLLYPEVTVCIACYSEWNTVNGWQKSLGHWCNVANYPCSATEAWKSTAIHCCSPFPCEYNVETQEKLQVLGVNIVCEVGREARQLKLYLFMTVCLRCVQKHQKCKFLPRLLFINIVVYCRLLLTFLSHFSSIIIGILSAYWMSRRARWEYIKSSSQYIDLIQHGQCVLAGIFLSGLA